VAAKRYLCTVEADYFSKLSKDSVESLALQGGPMSDAGVIAFQLSPYWKDAVALRRIDELAKDPQGPIPQFEEFTGQLLSSMKL
jgi:predicted HD phosphohydrolase